MRYCKKFTEEHPLCNMFPQFLQEINTIISDEGGTYFPFIDEVGLKLDKMKEQTDIKNMKSMDMVLCVKDNNDKLFSLMVEFKLNCNGTKKLSDGDSRDKIEDSKILLFGAGIPIHSTFPFIFNDSFLSKEESRSILNRKLNNATIEVLKISEFKTNYFD